MFLQIKIKGINIKKKKKRTKTELEKTKRMIEETGRKKIQKSIKVAAIIKIVKIDTATVEKKTKNHQKAKILKTGTIIHHRHHHHHLHLANPKIPHHHRRHHHLRLLVLPKK